MYCGYITTIKNLRKHNNADRLQIAEIYGNSVIVDLSYQLGDRVIYFPVDGQLSKEFAEENDLVRRKDAEGNNVGGYLDPDKRNIKALMLRGEKSDGLVLPISVLDKYVDTNLLTDGTQISAFGEHEICRKYIPRSNRRHTRQGVKTVKNKKESDKKISFPFFTEHIDTEQLAYNRSAFKEGDTVYITRKLHGTSFRVSNAIEVTTKKRNWIIKKIFHLNDRVSKKYEIVSGSRRVVLRDYNGGYYGSNEFRKKYNDYFIDKLPKGMTVYGEIVGWIDECTPIMPRCSNSKIKDKAFSKKYGTETVFTYGCVPGENKCYIYRITMTNEDGVCVEIPTEETIIWCERLGCEYVPLVDKFLYTTWEDLNARVDKWLDIPEPLANGTHIAEGVVVRIDNRSRFTAYKQKGFGFKVLEGIIKDNSDAPDIEEAESLISEEVEEET